MIACLLPAADFAIDAGADQARSGRRTEKQMIDAQPRVAREIISKVIPKGVDADARIQLAQRIGPAARDEAGEGVPHLRTKQSIIKPAFRLIDVKVCRYNVVVAGEDDRRGSGQQRFGMFHQAFQPAELVIEFWTWRWIAVGKIKTADHHVTDQRFDVAAVCVVWIAGQGPTFLYWILTARENGDAIPALLAVPNGPITRLANRGFWEFVLWRLQFLKARDIWFVFGEPA